MRREGTLAEQGGLPGHQQSEATSALKNIHSTCQHSRQIRKRNIRNARRPRASSSRQPEPAQKCPHDNSQTVTPTNTGTQTSLPQSRRSFDLSDLSEFLPAAAPSEKRLEDGLGQVWEYLQSIGEHLLSLQRKFPLPALSYSSYFGPAQRVRGISLISSHCSRLGFQLQTQFRAFDLFHRICTAAPFERYHSALKAATALYIAAKLEELYPPQAVCFISLDPIQQVLPENIIKLEAMVLFHLDYNLSRALPLHFAELLALRYELTAEGRRELLGLCLRSVLDEELWMGGGSMLARACVWVVERRGGGEVGGLEEELRWRVQAVTALLD